MTQTWNDLLFAHYAIEPAVLRALVPDVLTLDIFQGTAWLSCTPFWVSNLRPPGVPTLPIISKFPELNVRTYVTYQDKPGVYFFSLDAGNLSAVWGARMFYRLPYWHADMKLKVRQQARQSHQVRTRDIEYHSRRIHGPKAGSRMPEFHGTYGPVSPIKRASPGSLAEFLAERYCLYTWNRKRLYRAEIHHLPWPLQMAETEIAANSMADPIGITLPAMPDFTQFARSIKVLVWGPERLL